VRIQFPGALYQFINRGNLQGDVFVTEGARRAGVGVLEEACGRFEGWVHACVVIALTTPGLT
jgi:hypothetical protein